MASRNIDNIHNFQLHPSPLSHHLPNQHSVGAMAPRVSTPSASWLRCQLKCVLIIFS